MLRENLYHVRVKIEGTDGKTWSHVFDKFDGGDTTAKDTKYRPANGLKTQRSLGAASEVSDVKVTCLYDENVNAKEHWLQSQVGAATAHVHKQPLDGNGAPFGTPSVYSGTLDGITPPKTDSESDAAALFELDVSTVTVS